ncbi:MAG: helix-turn-helix transcriptional regulator [Porticoccaceae bacterium]|nr:helix-turn-helix transcriptional regulator [Porticoccaceae bacterium]OUS09309.1 transcriptional regulator [Gammaproteobacteria bacterium 54_18_T64]
MAQTNNLLSTLKLALKAQNKTYVDVAKALDLSEASVKRLFNEQSFSLSRLDQTCQLLGLEISDLVQLMNERYQRQLQQLSIQQEQEIADDLVLLLITVCVLNRWSFKQITEFYDITEAECIGKLVRLDRLRIIELLPNNHIKLRVAANFSWLDKGPIQHFFQTVIGQEFFRSDFQSENECLVVLNGMLSLQSNGEFQRRLMRLVREFNELNDHDAALEFDKRSGYTVVMALRTWRYGLFEEHIRSEHRNRS